MDFDGFWRILVILVVTANCPLGTPAGAQEPPPSNERWGVPGGVVGAPGKMAGLQILSVV